MNWYKKAQEKNIQLKDIFTADLTEEQKTKKDLISDKLGFGTGMIIRKVREQKNLDLGWAIDYIYDRIEKGLEPITCENCKWLIANDHKIECDNSNWKPADNLDNAACGGLSWEKQKI